MPDEAGIVAAAGYDCDAAEGACEAGSNGGLGVERVDMAFAGTAIWIAAFAIQTTAILRRYYPIGLR